MAVIDETTYPQVLARLVRLVALDPEQNTPEGRELLILAEAMAAYEKKRFPFDCPTADALEAFRRAEAGE